MKSEREKIIYINNNMKDLNIYLNIHSLMMIIMVI